MNNAIVDQKMFGQTQLCFCSKFNPFCGSVQKWSMITDISKSGSPYDQEKWLAKLSAFSIPERKDYLPAKWLWEILKQIGLLRPRSIEVGRFKSGS